MSISQHYGRLRGVIPPVLTPLTAEGDVDRPSLERLAGFMLEAGVSGLFAGGSSAEIALLDDAQRRDVIQTIVGTAAGQVPVLGGVINSGTRRVIEHAKVAEDLGVDAVVVTAPYYNETHDNEIRRHYRSIARAIGVPVVAYDLPSAVHTSIPSAVTIELAHEGTIVGIKDSSGDMINFREVVRGTSDLPFSVFVGNELVAEIGLFLGAHGLVPSLANVDPHGFVRLYEAAVAGDWAAVSAEQSRLSELKQIAAIGDPSRIGVFSGLMSGMKTALVQRGVIDSAAVSQPLSAISPAEAAQVAAMVNAAGLAPV